MNFGLDEEYVRLADQREAAQQAVSDYYDTLDNGGADEEWIRRQTELVAAAGEAEQAVLAYVRSRLRR